MNARTQQVPPDDELLSGLAAASPALRTEFQTALVILEDAVETGSGSSQWKTPTDPLGFPVVTYDERLWACLRATHALIQATGWEASGNETLPATYDAASSPSLTETAAFLVRIERAERFSEGSIEACIDNGTLLAALHALQRALPDG